MRKYFLILALSFFSTNGYNQTLCLGNIQLEKIDYKKISSKKGIKVFVDSLKTKILNDTIKFNTGDLVNLNYRKTNSKSYSPLIYIQMYSYKLDIIPGKLVEEFTDEFLYSSKIKKIIVITPENAPKIYGSIGERGVILIELRKNATVNYNVAGLFDSKEYRILNNFTPKKNEINIRN